MTKELTDRRRVADNIVKLTQEIHSYNTVKVLEELLKQAKNGELIGVAFVSIKPELNYAIGITGAAINHPECAIGMVYKLLNELNNFG